MSNEISGAPTAMEKILELIEEEKFQSAVEAIYEYLSIEHEDYINRLEILIKKLSHIAKKGAVVIRTLIPKLLKNLAIKDDVLRYAFVLALKPICEMEYEIILPFAKELLKSEDPNVKEGMLQLINFIANVYKIENKDLIKLILEKLSDEQEFVQTKAIQALKSIGKNNPIILEEVILESCKHAEDNFKEKCDNVLKTLTSVKDLEEKDIEKRELAVKEKELEEREIEIKKEELEFKEKELEDKEKALKDKVVDEELEQKEKILADKERELKEKELELKEKELEVEEKEKQLEEKSLEVKEELLEKKKELVEKEKELSHAELELKEKELKEKELDIREKEKQRIKKTLKKVEKKQKK